MVKKYKLQKVVIEETDDGILIRSAVQDTDFQKAIAKLSKNKATLYKRMERFVKRLGSLPTQEMDEVKLGLIKVLDLLSICISQDLFFLPGNTPQITHAIKQQTWP